MFFFRGSVGLFVYSENDYDINICPSINQGRIEARLSIENRGDPRASISSGPLQVLTVRAEAVGPLLHRPSALHPPPPFHLPSTHPIAGTLRCCCCFKFRVLIVCLLN